MNFLKRKPMVRKTTHNDTTKEPTIKQINSNTQIVFTVKSFFGLTGALLTLFFGFYQLVVVPKFNSLENADAKILGDQKDQNAVFYQQLNTINASIGSLSATIESFNRDKTNNSKANDNTGGSLGSNNSNSSSRGSIANH